MKRLLLCAALALAGPVAAQTAPVEGQTVQPPVAEGGYRYQLFLPRGYARARARLPLMIFLHGSGERGEDIERVKANGPPRLVGTQPDFPFVLVSPLLAADADWDQARLDALLAHVERTHRVDPDRIVLTGLSRGAHAVWRWAAARPDRFAAIAPVSGRGDPISACRLREAAVWAFHGDADDVVEPEGSTAMAAAIRDCGGAPRLTIYPGVGHDAWTAAYADPALSRWLLAQRRRPR